MKSVYQFTIVLLNTKNQKNMFEKKVLNLDSSLTKILFSIKEMAKRNRDDSTFNEDSDAVEECCKRYQELSLDLESLVTKISFLIILCRKMKIRTSFEREIASIIQAIDETSLFRTVGLARFKKMEEKINLILGEKNDLSIIQWTT